MSKIQQLVSSCEGRNLPQSERPTSRGSRLRGGSRKEGPSNA